MIGSFLSHKNTVFFTLVFCWQTVAFAQDGTFVIDDMTFHCPSCRYISDSLCQIYHGASSQVMKCSPTGRSTLLNEAIRAYDGKHPSANELTRFLLSPANESDLDLVFRLLFNADGGRIFLEQNARNLIKLRLHILHRLLEEGAGNADIWRIFWNVTSFAGSSNEIRFKTMIAVYVSGFNLSDFLTEFTAQDLVKESELCSMFANAFSRANDAWANQFSSTAQILKLCENDMNTCGHDIPTFLDPALVRYVGKVKLFRLLRGFNEGHLTPDQFLTLLSQADFRAYSTPDVFKAVSEALKKSQIRDENTKHMISYFVAADPEIKAVWKGLKINTDQPTGFNNPTWIFIITISLALIFGFFKFRARKEFLEQHFLPKDNEELRELLSDFGLDFTASLEDLSKQYRKKARKCHPDTKQSDSQAFIELQKKYTRTKELIQKLR